MDIRVHPQSVMSFGQGVLLVYQEVHLQVLNSVFVNNMCLYSLVIVEGQLLAV